MIILPILTYLTYTFLFKRLGECTFWAWEWKGYVARRVPRRPRASSWSVYTFAKSTRRAFRRLSPQITERNSQTAGGRCPSFSICGQETQSHLGRSHPVDSGNFPNASRNGRSRQSSLLTGSPLGLNNSAREKLEHSQSDKTNRPSVRDSTACNAFNHLINFRFPLQPHQKYSIAQCEEPRFLQLTQMKDDYTTNSYYLTYTFLFEAL